MEVAMPATISALWRSRLKGSYGFFPQHLVVSTVVGVLDDRQFAIRRKAGGDMSAWAPKGAFHVCMNTPSMACERPLFDTCLDGLDCLHADYRDQLQKTLGIKGELLVQNAKDAYSLHDTKGAYVSFLNLATVQALAEYMGVDISPQRFRMNVHMTGLEPFEELSWVDASPGTRIIEVGNNKFRVDHECKRCKAIDASPGKGYYDLEVREALDEMMKKRGYKSPRGETLVMGVLAVPLDEGRVEIGDSIRLLP